MGKVKVSRRTAEKAAVLLAILLLQFDFSSCESASLFSVVGTVNGNVTLSPSNAQHATEIMWKKGKNKVIEWDSDGFNSYPPFDGRVRLDSTTGDLHISNLMPSDEGEYEVEILSPSKSMKFNLVVFDPLPSPMLGCNLVNESIEVRCRVPETYNRHREQLTYSWRCSSPPCGESTTPVVHFEKNGNLPEQVQCVVTNPESNRTSSVALSTCIPHDNPRHRYLLMLTLAIVAGVCVLVICCWKYSRKAGPTTSS